ncbi:hypothetical protein HDU83_007928 [Entophlyctis luteolus]|nr:hypothetical protein HDU83_007928 [Entophlyctis luteolus]
MADSSTSCLCPNPAAAPGTSFPSDAGTTIRHESFAKASMNLAGVCMLPNTPLPATTTGGDSTTAVEDPGSERYFLMVVIIVLSIMHALRGKKRSKQPLLPVPLRTKIMASQHALSGSHFNTSILPLPQSPVPIPSLINPHAISSASVKLQYSLHSENDLSQNETTDPKGLKLNSTNSRNGSRSAPSYYTKTKHQRSRSRNRISGGKKPPQPTSDYDSPQSRQTYQLSERYQTRYKGQQFLTIPTNYAHPSSNGEGSNEDDDDDGSDFAPQFSRRRRRFQVQSPKPIHKVSLPKFEPILSTPTATPTAVATHNPNFQFPSRLPSASSQQLSRSASKFSQNESLKSSMNEEKRNLVAVPSPKTIPFEHGEMLHFDDTDEEHRNDLRVADNSEQQTINPVSSHGSFWKHPFSRSRDGSMYEVHDTANGGSSSSSGSVGSAQYTASGLLPKLSLFKRKADAEASNATVSIIKNFWSVKSGGKQESPAPLDVDDEAKNCPIVSLDGGNSAQSQTVVVPLLKLPKVKARKGKDAHKKQRQSSDSASKGKSDSIEVKSSGVSRFWPAPSPSSSGVSPSKSKNMTKKSPALSASKLADVAANRGEPGETGSSAQGSNGKTFWGKPTISYAEVAAGSESLDIPKRSRDLEDSANWLDVDDFSHASGKTSIDSDAPKPTLMSRLTKWQTTSSVQAKPKYLLKPVSDDKNGISSSLFSLKKRMSNETMRNEFIRMLSSSSNEVAQKPIETPAEPLLSASLTFPAEIEASNLIGDYGNMGESDNFLHSFRSESEDEEAYFHGGRTDGRFGLNLFEHEVEAPKRKRSLVEPIHRPLSGTPKSISSAPTINPTVKHNSVASINSDPNSNSPLYSPFFSGLEIPEIQRASVNLDDSSSFAVESKTRTIDSNTSNASQKSRHHHYHHHHHFYHFPTNNDRDISAFSGATGNTRDAGVSEQTPLNLPLLSIQNADDIFARMGTVSAGMESYGASGFRRLRKFSHDAGMFQRRHQIMDVYKERPRETPRGLALGMGMGVILDCAASEGAPADARRRVASDRVSRPSSSNDSDPGSK